MKEDKVIIIRNSEAFDSFKNGFSAQGGVLRPSARLPGYHVCPGHLWLTPSHPSLTFDRDTDVRSFEIIFLIANRPNEKTSRKQKKKFGLIFIFTIFFLQNFTNISRKVLLNCFLTRSGQTVFSPSNLLHNH